MTGVEGSINITRGITISTNTTFYLVAQASGTSTVSNTIMYAIRVGQVTLGAAPTNTSGGNATPNLGGTLTYNLVSPGSGAPGSGGNYSSLTVVTPGIYLANFSINQAYSGVITSAFVDLTGTNTANNCAYGYNNATTSIISFQGSQIITCTASAYGLRLTFTGATMGSFTGYFYLTRIGQVHQVPLLPLPDSLVEVLGVQR